MIKSIRLRNFKCFKDELLELKHLTVLCGRNNVGKSTCIQGLLLAKEAARASASTPNRSAVSLNNVFGYDFGTLSDLLPDQPDSQDITFSLDAPGGVCDVIFEAHEGDLDKAFAYSNHVGPFPHAFELTTPNLFTYLSAERLGPRDTLPVQSKPDEMMGLGSSGEYVAEVLERFEYNKIRKELRCPTDLTLETLQLQVEEWMNQWIPGLQLRARKYEDASVAEMRFSKKGFKSDWKKPANIGFGVSYSLPLVVAGLLSPKGAILIIDTPEAHLHPAGQSAIGGFLARLAAGGVQVIVETHSDHVINGLRLAVANPDHPIKTDEILINNFDKTETGPSIKKISIDRFGGLTSWPAGFLDQIEQDLAKLARIDSGIGPSKS